MQHVVSQLLTKRRELAGELKYYQKHIRELAEQINAIDTSITIFDKNINIRELDPIRFSPKQRFFNYGEVMRLILDILRDSNTPIKTSILVREVLKKKGYGDKEYRYIFPTIRASLYAQEKKGILVMDNLTGKEILWSINPN